MINDKFIAMDVETGGIGDDKSLLTAYFGLFSYKNNNFVKEDELDLKIKPDNKVYCITAESLTINKINIVEHDAVAITQRAAGTELYKKLDNWYKSNSGNKLIPVGHNVAFDIRKVKTTLVSEGNWEKFVSYRVIDTCTIAQFMRIKGTLPYDQSISLVNLAEYFDKDKDKEIAGVFHEARYDALTTIKVLEKLLLL